MIIKIRLYWKEKKYKYIEYTLDSPELIFFFPYKNLLGNKSEITRKEELFINLFGNN